MNQNEWWLLVMIAILAVGMLIEFWLVHREIGQQYKRIDRLERMFQDHPPEWQRTTREARVAFEWMDANRTQLDEVTRLAKANQARFEDFEDRVSYATKVADQARKKMIADQSFIQPHTAVPETPLDEDIALLERRGWTIERDHDGFVTATMMQIGGDGEPEPLYRAWIGDDDNWSVWTIGGGPEQQGSPPLPRAADILLWVEKQEGNVG